MVLELSGGGVMGHLWESMDKTEDGEHIEYSPEEVEQLWNMGFVDTERITLEAWKQAFEPYAQPDGYFKLNRDEFYALDKFRYKGEIHIPFDPMLINEGRYTDEGLDELISASIAPSCSLTPNKLSDFFNQLKNDFRQSDKLILIKKPAKDRIKALLDAHPSPLRNLELILDHVFLEKSAEFEQEVEDKHIYAASMEAARQASMFASRPVGTVEAKAKKFDELKKVKKKKDTDSDDGKPKVELKKIMRSRKGFRG